MTQEHASKQIAEKLEAARKLISEAEEIADANGVGFSWDIAYGMGGWYIAKGDEDWYESTAKNEGSADNGYWQSSSSSC